MDKKIINLIMCVLICFIIILGLFIFKLAAVEKEVTTTSKTEPVLEETVIDDPVEGDFKVHKSENGYTVKYPADMEALRVAKSIDFILEDEKSGSSLNIVTAKNDGSVTKMSREEFEHSLMHTSEETVLLSYEEVMLNGAAAVVAEYTYMDNAVKQVVVMTESCGYNITVMESSYITEEMSEIFDGVINSFTLN